jgi:hypothetical protein
LWTLPTVLIAACTIAFVTSNTSFGKFLSGKTLVYNGKISYPLYLWHFPSIILAKYLLVPAYSDKFAVSLAIVVTVIASILTYHFVEQPFRTKFLLSRKTSLLAASASALLVLISVGYMGHTGTIEARSLLENPQLAHLKEGSSLPNGLSMSNCAARNSTTQCQLINTVTDINTARKVLLVGDSFAANLISPLYELLAAERNLSLDARLTYACSYMPSRYAEWRGECGLARRHIDQIQRDEITDLIFHVDFVEWLRGKSKSVVQNDLTSLTNLFASLIGKNIRVHVVGHRNVYTIEPKRAFLYPWLMPFLNSLDIPPELKRNYALWKELGVNVLFTDKEIPRSDAYLYYSDRGHMTPKGAKEFSVQQGLRNTNNLWPGSA